MPLQQFEPKKIYIRVNAQPITTSGIYHNSDLGLISLSSDGSNWITIADKNLGATSTDISSTDSYGNYYQWGNNYGWGYTDATGGTITTSDTQVNAGSYGPGNYYSSSTFITKSTGALNGRWDTSNNANLRGGTTDTNEAKRGPCPEGYHIPSLNEGIDLFSKLNTTMGLTPNDIRTYLNFPTSGFIGYRGSTAVQYTAAAYMWYSTRRGNEGGYYYSQHLRFMPSSNYINYQDYTYNTYGLPIRPFSNEAVQPDESRTKLY